MKHLGKQFIAFTIVGSIATAVQYFILVLLVELVKFQPVLASSIGFIFGGIVSYYLNRKVTFQSDKKHRIAMVQYLCVAAVAFWLNGMFMSFGIHHFNLNYITTQILTTSLILFWNFLANRFWTFRIKTND